MSEFSDGEGDRQLRSDGARSTVYGKKQSAAAAERESRRERRQIQEDRYALSLRQRQHEIQVLEHERHVREQASQSRIAQSQLLAQSDSNTAEHLELEAERRRLKHAEAEIHSANAAYRTAEHNAAVNQAWIEQEFLALRAKQAESEQEVVAKLQAAQQAEHKIEVFARRLQESEARWEAMESHTESSAAEASRRSVVNQKSTCQKRARWSTSVEGVLNPCVR